MPKQKPTNPRPSSAERSVFAKNSVRCPKRRYPSTDVPWFWALLALTPVGVVLGEMTRRTTKSLRQNLSARRADATSLAQLALQHGEKALLAGEGKKAIANAEKALFHAIEGATGLKGRGLLRDELALATEGSRPRRGHRQRAHRALESV